MALLSSSRVDIGFREAFEEAQSTVSRRADLVLAVARPAHDNTVRPVYHLRIDLMCISLARPQSSLS